MDFPGDPGFTYLDDEERAEIEEIEANAETLVALPEADRLAAIEVFRAAAKSGRRPLSVRMENSDIAALKRLAEREGIPYQTLLGSIVHKYVTGALVDVNEARKLFARTRLK
ncbi:MAG: hypothetical protein ACLQMF_13760 [Rectinemataceae bacterium]